MRLPHRGQMKVNPASGSLQYVVEDLSIPCRGGMRLMVRRHYNSLSQHRSNSIGAHLEGWCFNFDEHLRFEYVARKDVFVPISGMDYLLYGPDDTMDMSVTLRAVSIEMPDRKALRYLYQSGQFIAVDAWNRFGLVANSNGTYTLTIPGQGTHVFGVEGRLRIVQDTFGNQIQYDWTVYPGSDHSRVYMSGITDPAGRKVTTTISRSGNDGYYTLKDWAGRSWTYHYTFVPNLPTLLVSVTDADGNVTNYTYNTTGPTVPPPSRLLSSSFPDIDPTSLTFLNGLARIDFPNGTFLTNYAAGGRPIWKRVGLQIFGDRLAVLNQYDIPNRQMTRYVGSYQEATRYGFDANFQTTSASDPLDNTYNYVRDANGRIVQGIDPRLGVRTLEYDETKARLVSQTNTLGYTRTADYHPTFNVPVKVTTPGPDNQGLVRTRTYDPSTGRLLSQTDPLGNTVTWEYDSMGHLVASTGKRGERHTFAYDATTGLCTAVTDPLGNTTTYSYDSLGRVLSRTSPEGRTVRYAYTPCGLVTSVTDPSGHVRSFKYDGNRNLIQKTDELGNVTRYAYNTLNELTQMTDALGDVTSYTYTSKGQIATMTDSLGHVTAYAYDALGRQIEMADAKNQITTMSYDGACGTTTTTDPLGRVTTSSRDLMCRNTQSTLPDGSVLTTTFNPDNSVSSTTDALGNLRTYVTDALRRTVQTTDALGRTTRSVYDANGNVISSVDARGNITTSTYDLNNRLISVRRPDGTTVSYAYDRDGLRVSMTDARGQVWKTVYDANGRQVGSIDPLGNLSQTVYDAAGRAVKTISPLGRTTSMTYDALGRRMATTDPSGSTTSQIYDLQGNQRTVIDALGRAVHMVYDEMNRVVQTVDPAGSITTSSYDAGGRVTVVTDANGNVTSYQFDMNGHVVAEIYPDGSRLTYAWDANGNLLSKTDPRGFVTTYKYDAANQLTTVSMPDSSTVALSYDVAGNIVQRQDATGTYLFAYDVMNRPSQITQNGSIYKLTYDPDGRRISVTFPDQRKASMAYDSLGRATSVTTPDAGVTTLSYDADSRRVGTRYANGTAATAAYDLNSRMVRLVHQDASGNNLTADFRMAYDAVGNMLTVTDAATPMWSYSYDPLNRLTQAIDQLNSHTSSWTYDRLGNRLSATVDGVTTNYAYNNLNQLVQMGDTRLFWDANGNLAQKVAQGSVTSYRFDSRDRLVEVGLPTTQRIGYEYDQQGRMIKRTDDSGSTIFEWNGWDLAREVDPAGHVTRYFYNGSEMVGFARDDQHYRVHSDWLSSVRSVTDQAGNTVFSAAYGPWGDQLSVSDSVPSGGLAMRWVGALGVRFDSETGLHYMRQRFFDSSIGRFLSRDAIGSTNNAYMYAGGNPLSRIDPTGLSDLPVTVNVNLGWTSRTAVNPEKYLYIKFDFINWDNVEEAVSIGLSVTRLPNNESLYPMRGTVSGEMWEAYQGKRRSAGKPYKSKAVGLITGLPSFYLVQLQSAYCGTMYVIELNMYTEELYPYFWVVPVWSMVGSHDYYLNITTPRY